MNSESSVRVKQEEEETMSDSKIEETTSDSKIKAVTNSETSNDQVLVLDAADDANASAQNGQDGKVPIVAVANETQLSHLRQDCTKYKFIQDAVGASQHGTKSRKNGQRERSKAAVRCNQQFCELCHCYVCDKPAKDCEKWQNRSTPSFADHCHASSDGDDCERWERMREQGSRKKSTSRPIRPDDQVGSSDSSLTKCRRCGWYNRFYLDKFPNGRHPVCYFDWCHHCGRVASEKDFGKEQNTPYEQKPDQFSLGKRVIRFRIVAHDPRQMGPYKKIWKKADQTQPEWKWDPASMEADVFNHRVGPRPTLGMILESIPIVSEDRIPKTGVFRQRIASLASTDSAVYYYGDSKTDADQHVSPDEADAVILERTSDVLLLHELKNTFLKSNVSASSAGFNISAEWSTEARSGELTIEVFLKGGYKVNHLSKFLHVWFDLAPFSLAELNKSMKAKPDNPISRELRVPVPPFSLDSNDALQIEAYEKVRAQRDMAVEENNMAVKSVRKQFSLRSGQQSSSIGGVCTNEVDLRGVLRGYFQELLADERTSSYASECRNVWCEQALDVVSHHRFMRGPGIDNPGDDLDIDLLCYLRREDFALASEDLRRKGISVESINGIMDHLVNLDHPAAPFVEGLNVELLDFQRQSVQWALERETCPGGVQSFLWPKLPPIEGSPSDLYFNPVLERIRSDKPRLVRGGIIGEEMGLGKTIISLALILQNSAPELPVSGSPACSINAIDTAQGQTGGWDKELYPRTSTSNAKRGSILSRGTLVVCPVSLVGQWIEEAKSKLKDPGLVYPYHGQGRTRDPTVLAANSIVVTTYQVLASDATYHAKKEGGGYCAPLEQVRWWRIICDEGHSIRDASTQSFVALSNIVADHKWIVTGTPVNTSFNDLINQLKFIGFENISESFRIFRETVYPSKGMRSWGSDPRKLGHFVFFMRKIMMRHKQNQKYRGTLSTLMSLPAKTERVMEIEWDGSERIEYLKAEEAARSFYIEFKKDHAVGKHFLLLSQKLVPTRIACSGGRIPLDDGEKETDLDEHDSEPPKKKSRKEVLFSKTFYRSKFQALLKELIRVRDNDIGAKSLVFSQFTSTLHFLQQELPKHGFQFRTLSGDMPMKKRAEALHKFQHDPPTTIFLLSMRAGAVGINLTQANRVFLMEPSFNPALEAQAIGRVHRLGQKRKVEIVRLIMKDSVESRLAEMLQKKYGDSNDTATNGSEGCGFVGSLMSDKATVLSGEFDLLYGVTNASPPDEEAMSLAEEASVAS